MPPRTTRRSGGVTLDDGREVTLPGSDDAVIIPPEPETPVDRVATMLADVSGDDKAKLKCYRRNDETGAFDWCADWRISEFEAGGFEMVRRKFGAGTFRLVLYGFNPNSNTHGIRAKEIVTLAPSNEPDPPPVAVQQSNTDSFLREFMAHQAARDERLLQALTQRPDPMAAMRDTLTLVATMREAFGLGNPPPRSSVSELIAGVRELREAEGLIGGKDDKETSLMDLAPSLLEMISGAIKQQRGEPAQAPMPPVHLPASLTKPEPVAPVAPTDGTLQPETDEPTEEQEREAAMNLLRGQLAQLLTLAPKGDASIDDAAEHAYEVLPDELLKALETEPRWLEYLVMFEPACKGHEAWLTKVRDRTVEIIVEERRDAHAEQEREAAHGSPFGAAESTGPANAA